MLYDKLIIDTNLLLLLIIGSVDDGIHINKSSRLSSYNIEDFDNILEITSIKRNKSSWLPGFSVISA
jgi:hypothetical protein